MGAGGSCCQGAGDDERMVTKMDLSHCGCSDVPPVVFQAERYVETLNLAHNRILSLPPQLFHCQELKHLNLVDNGLDSIPAAIGSLVHLVSLKLDKNCIKDLPDNLKACRKLRRLSVSNNPLQQLPGVVTQLISLEELCLNDCDLSFLPANVGRLTKLTILELRNNRLCNLPLSMSRITTLIRLDLGDNSFETLPECSTSLAALQELLMDNNELETISGAGLSKLQHLDVSYNNLRSVHKDLGQCTALTLLNLGWNYLESLPETLAGLTQLEGLVVEMNELTSLPCALGQMARLEELNVANNRLCDLPPSLGLLRRLAALNLSRNYVQDLPCEIGSCIRLSIINASYNRLQSLPAEVGYLNNLKVLDLVGNFLMYLPMSMSNLQGVRAIWLSANQNVPLIPFTEDVSMASGERFLTNIALPQLGETTLPPPDNTEPAEKASWRRKIRFEEDEQVLPGRLDRTPTPFPKELRCPARKAARAEDNYVNVVDGRVAVFQNAQQPPSNASYPDSNVTIIREANIRRNNVKGESDGSVEAMSAGEEAIYGQNRREAAGSEVYGMRPDVTNGEVVPILLQNGTEPLRRASFASDQQVEGYASDRPQEVNESSQTDGCYFGDQPGTADSGHYSQSLYQARRAEEVANGEPEPTYGMLVERQENGRMSPISEEEGRQEMGRAGGRASNGGVEANAHLCVTEAAANRTQLCVDEAPAHRMQLCVDEAPTQRVDVSVDADAVSIDSFESERRRSLADSIDNRSQPIEMNRNQAIYSNLRNGNSFQPGNPVDPRAYQHRGYYAPSPQPPAPRSDGAEGYVPYRNMPGHPDLSAQFPADHGPRQAMSLRAVRQSPYGTIRQSPHPVENGNGSFEMERPPSKQEMLSIAERNRSQNISPPCYEIAKMYSTKAALFEHCHRQSQT